MKTKFTYLLYITTIFLFVVLLYPLFIILCIFSPLKVRGYFLKLENNLKILKWLETINKKHNGI